MTAAPAACRSLLAVLLFACGIAVSGCANHRAAHDGTPGGGLKGEAASAGTLASAGSSAVASAEAQARAAWSKAAEVTSEATVTVLKSPQVGLKSARRAYNMVTGTVDTIDGRPVQGYVVGTTETFTGFVTSAVFGGGRLEIVTSSGLKCAGDYEYATDDHAQGMLRCSNGGTGPFQFITTQRNGSSGTGTFGKSLFRFSIG
jgi:hypothetical protein